MTIHGCSDIKHPPRQTPIRILVCVWWLATIVIVNIYLGTLFEQLVLPRRPRSIETLEELVNQNQIKWCVTRGSALQELFLGSAASSIYGQLGKRMLNVSNADEGVDKVLNSNWAFIRERSMLTFKIAREHHKLGACRMQLAREQFFSVGFGLALKKNSPYLEPFNAALTLMIENGLVARWQSQYWPQRTRFTECKPHPMSQGEPLSLKHFLSIYLVFTLLTLFAFAVLVYQHGKEASSRLFDANFRTNPINTLDTVV